MFSKIDLSDGFWRMIVQVGQQWWNFAYVMPNPPGSPVRIVVPSQLQMGWAESPAYFCAATETGRDHIQGLNESHTQLRPHKFEQYVRPHKATKPSKSGNPAHGVYVYVDDYILACQRDSPRPGWPQHITQDPRCVPPAKGIRPHQGGRPHLPQKSIARGCPVGLPERNPRFPD
jgi:hypothetical protein